VNYYISDLHFGHEKIIRLCHRPFKTVEEMDLSLISSWNSVVGKRDDVYILGDFGKTSVDLCKILDLLNGKKHLIVGNHDKQALKNRHFRNRFEDIRDIATVHDDGKRIILFHYPMAEWDCQRKGTWHFYGHIHNVENRAQKMMRQNPRSVNVCADCIGFKPRTARELTKGRTL